MDAVVDADVIADAALDVAAAAAAVMDADAVGGENNF